jgi:long-subunit fatty acid transport protein
MISMRKIILTSCFFIYLTSYAQEEQIQQEEQPQQTNQPKFWDQVRFGGGIGMAFGSNQTTIAISPSAIYEFNDMFAFGLGTSYLYSKNFDFRSNVYGIGLISLFNPFEGLQLSAELEQLFVNQKLTGFETNNFNYPTLNLGVAYRMGMFSAGIRYDVLYDENKNIYASPWSPILRIYF